MRVREKAWAGGMEEFEREYDECMEKCWEVCPSARPNFTEIYESIRKLSQSVTPMLYRNLPSLLSPLGRDSLSLHSPLNHSLRLSNRHESLTESYSDSMSVHPENISIQSSVTPIRSFKWTDRIVCCTASSSHIWIGGECGGIAALPIDLSLYGESRSLFIQNLDSSAAVRYLEYVRENNSIWCGCDGGEISVWKGVPVKGRVVAEEISLESHAILCEANGKTHKGTLNLICGTLSWNCRSKTASFSAMLTSQDDVSILTSPPNHFKWIGKKGEKIFGVTSRDSALEWVRKLRLSSNFLGREQALFKLGMAVLKGSGKTRKFVEILSLRSHAGFAWSHDQLNRITEWKLAENVTGMSVGVRSIVANRQIQLSELGFRSNCDISFLTVCDVRDVASMHCHLLIFFTL